ncbi:MAG TPA: hypothetical protein VK154_11500 [Chitinophagales bacterium]|nr:hypothetical protein [Chitinophagales bacterium]
MSVLLKNLLLFVFLVAGVQAFGQKTSAEIFIPITNRSEIWLRPKIDTLENKKEYEFKIRVSPEYKISQFLFEKGLAIQNDSVLVIIPNSTKYGDVDTATLRVIVNSISGSRIMLFQKKFIIKVPEKLFPVLSNPKNNLIKVNDKVFLERNKTYVKDLFTSNKPFVTMYESETNMKPVKVTNVTVALMEREGKQYNSNADTLSADAIREIKKIRNPIPVYIKVDGTSGKTKKSVWSRVIVYQE